MSPQPHAVLIGAGVAGAAVGMFLRDIGYRVTLCEGRPKDEGWLGSYFSLADNGRAVLECLGLLGDVEAAGTPTESIVFQSHRGRALGSNNEPTTLIRRDALGRVLRAGAERRGVHIRYGARLVDLKSDTAGVTATFADGSTERGDVLVGCDGIFSRTRRLLFPNHPPVSYTGIIDGGGVAPAVPGVDADGVLRLTFGAKAFFGYQGLPSGEVVWFQSLADPHGATGPQQVDVGLWRDRLVELHSEDHAPILDIIAATEGQLVRWPVHELVPLPSWSDGPVCLAGDAAHAMEPHDGQSASMAMEDALVLARCLRDEGTPPAAFKRFHALRADRVATIAAQARHTGSLKFPVTDRERRARDVVLAMYLRSGTEASMEVSRYRLDWP